jgi:HEAT repeat protein
MRLSAVLGMGRSCDLRWGPLLLHELRSESAAMRYEAILACGELGLLDSVPTLGERLHDSDPQIVEATIWALGQIGGSAARHLLLDAYDGADEDIQTALDEALAEQALASSTSDLMLYELDNLEDQDWIEEGRDLPWDSLDEEDSPETGLDA